MSRRPQSFVGNYMNIEIYHMAIKAARDGNQDLFRAIFSTGQITTNELIFCELNRAEFDRSVAPLTHALLHEEQFDMAFMLLDVPYAFPLSINDWMKVHEPECKTSFQRHSDILVALDEIAHIKIGEEQKNLPDWQVQAAKALSIMDGQKIDEDRLLAYKNAKAGNEAFEENALFEAVISGREATQKIKLIEERVTDLVSRREAYGTWLTVFLGKESEQIAA